MVKRKKQRKIDGIFQKKSIEHMNKPKISESTKKPNVSNNIQVTELALKILAIVLGIIMVIALTLYMMGRMPGRGFWILTILVGIIAFVIIPVIRKKYIEMK